MHALPSVQYEMSFAVSAAAQYDHPLHLCTVIAPVTNYTVRQ